MITSPTVEQLDIYGIAYQELRESVARLVVEGIDVRIIIAGLSAVAADTVRKAYGDTQVGPWFIEQGALCFRHKSGR